MANDIKLSIVGYLREKYPIEEFGNFRKRECVIRTVKKKMGDYTINDYLITFWNDNVNMLDMIYPGHEVIARVKLKGTIYLDDQGNPRRWKEKLSPKLSLIGEDIFEKPNGKIAKDDVWKLPNGYIEKDKAPAYLNSIVNGNTLTEEDMEKRFPNDRTYKAETFNFKKSEQKEEDDLPF